MKNCNKISLLKDMAQTCSRISDQEIEKDKRIGKINKDAATMFCCSLVAILIIYQILIGAHLCEFEFSYFYGLISLVAYCVLLVLCHSNAIKGNSYVLLYAVWSFIVFPIALDNIILNLLGNTLAQLEPRVLLLMIPLLIAIVCDGTMYWVASVTYKKASIK